jgi:hypothetical protein
MKWWERMKEEKIQRCTRLFLKASDIPWNQLTRYNQLSSSFVPLTWRKQHRIMLCVGKKMFLFFESDGNTNKNCKENKMRQHWRILSKLAFNANEISEFLWVILWDNFLLLSLTMDCHVSCCVKECAIPHPLR